MARCSLHCALWGQRSPGQDLFSLGVTGGDTWGDLATNVNVNLIYANQDDDDGRPMPYEIWRGEYNVPGEVGFRPVSAGQGRRANSEDNYGWLIPMFYTTHSSSFPTPWDRNFQTPGDALCQLVFHTWLTEAYNQGSLSNGLPAVASMSVFSSRVSPPQIYDKDERENHYSAMPSTSYVDSQSANPFLADQGSQRSYPTYVHHFGWNHYPGSIYCYTQCPPSPANY